VMSVPPDAARPAAEFWETLFAQGASNSYSTVEMPPADDPVLLAALQSFGALDGKRLLDIGCGSGRASLFFASHGARVTSVDLSANAIANLTQFCAARGITNIDARVLAAMQIDALGPFECVFGSMILHHIEPFHEFAAILRRAMTDDGRAFFWENHLALPMMGWFRTHCVGRFGIPRHGDTEEVPFSDAEVDQLRSYFQVNVEYPEMMLFKLFSLYLLGRRLTGVAERLDDLLYNVKPLRRLSYRQFVRLGPGSPAGFR